MKRVFPVLAVLVLALPGSGFARMYEKPRSFSLPDPSLQRFDRKTLAAIDAARLLADESARTQKPGRPGPLRFAVPEKVVFDSGSAGTWQDISDGRLWRLRIHAPGAVNLNLGITRFDLPEGAKLWIYDPARRRVEGPYTSRHRSRHGRLWTPVIGGDEMVVELFVPARALPPTVTIGQVGKGFRDLVKQGPTQKDHGTCNNDVICPEGDPWRDQIRSVAMYTINGTGGCTGTLMNNTALDFKPLFLSANHCGVDTTNDDTLVFTWNFESVNCGDQGGGSLADTQTGATFRASFAASDFLLVELNQAPDPAFNVFFSGWDVTGTAPASTVGIHHPSLDVKSISFNTNAVTSTAWGSSMEDLTEDHWRVDAWEDGTTELGSSGSCLWDEATKRCIGQLHGGTAFCDVPNGSDWYGKLSASWEGGGSANMRLRDWLDPGNTGVLGLDGDPHITTLDGTQFDFQGAGEFVALRDPAGTEVQVRQAAIATTFNPGPSPYHGLATCVSLNTAVAARVGNHRVTYQPNLSGVPDPSGMQLRIDGALTSVGPGGIQLGNGRILRTAAEGGIEIEFPDKYALQVTPSWWSSQSKWYLNVGVRRTPAMDGFGGASPGSGMVPAGGIAGAIPPGSWLPLLPDGSALGPMPVSLHDRYVELYQDFGKAWRVTNATSLFDYAPGTSTETFTIESWPPENPPCTLPNVVPVQPLSLAEAQLACKPIGDPQARANCVFDVRVTGERGFANTYLASQRVARGSTLTTVREHKDPTEPGETLFLTAIVTRRAHTLKGVPTGTVQFTVNGERLGDPIRLDETGRATLKLSSLPLGTHTIAASYAPTATEFLPSVSANESHDVKKP